MAKVLLKVLPLAAVLLATSCSKDDNNDETKIDNQPKVEKVVIPFSVKVNTGNSLSKIAYTVKDNDVSQFDVTFTNADEGTEMNIESEGNIEPTTLILVQEGNDFVFKGDITLAEGITEDDFNSGFNISGSFGEAGETVVTSTTSLADAMSECKHQYTSTFSSKDETINLDDNYAYLEISCASTQEKFNLTIDGSSEVYTPNATTKKIWFAIPSGKSVTGNLVKTMTVQGGKVYRADRTDVVDLNLASGVLWKTSDENDQIAYANISIPTGYRLPTNDELNELLAIRHRESNRFNMYNDYGSVFFGLAGFNGSNQAGQVGYYWSGTEYESDKTKAYDLVLDDRADIASHIGQHDKTNTFSVRAVRQLNN